MKVCNEIKKLIDEADQPDLFSFQVSNHLSSCVDCKSFADERTALRALLASGKRVSVPNNFDAMLTARIAEAKAGRALSWLSAPSFARLGAATVALAVMIFVAQYGNLFSDDNRVAQPESSVTAAANTAPAINPQKSSDTPAAQIDVNGFANIKPGRSQQTASVPVKLTQHYYPRRGSQMATNRVAPEDYPPLEEGGVVLVRGPNGEREVPMPTVSVGAQSLFYSRQSQPVRNVSTSF